MRVQETDDGPQDVGTLEAVKVKILVQGDGAEVESLRVELTSESDLFFHYTHTATEESFRVMQAEQKLMVDFADYANVLARSLNSAIKEPHRSGRGGAHTSRCVTKYWLLWCCSHLAVFVMHREGHARLDFIQVCSRADSWPAWLPSQLLNAVSNCAEHGI
jgi:hypothetical protein